MTVLPDTVVERAPAKLNPFLRVLGRRPDGYHELETVLLPLDLADRVEVHARSDPGQFRTLSVSLTVSGDPAAAARVPVDGSKLTVRAAEALARRIGARGFADIHLEKEVPPAAGRGGGSSDAAAVLRALNGLWGAGLDDADLAEVAATLGSDVPALLRAGPVLARGRGERVDEVAAGPLRWALVTFGFGVGAGDAYGWWDADPGSTGPGGEVLAALRPEALASDAGHERLAGLLSNDLEGPVASRHPEIGEAKDALFAGGAVGAVMSGSGPSVAGLLPPGRARLDPAAEARLARLSGRPPRYVRSTGAADGE